MRGEDAGRAFDLSGDEILDAIGAFLGRFVVYPDEHCRDAHVLWCAHAHLMDAWDSTPRLAFLSPEPASGKSRALEVTEPLVPRPVLAVNTTPAYLFRKVADPEGRPTILFDEIDTIFGPKAKEHEEIRGLLNAGHRKGAVAGRCVPRGNVIVTEEIPAYAAVALAGLGALPDTIMSRAVIIHMRRRAPGERIEPYRPRIHAPEGEGLGEMLGDWLSQVHPRYPDAMPAGVEDRDADVWEPLLAVADLASGEWPERARAAAVALVSARKAGAAPSLGVRLLGDIRTAFGIKDLLPTNDLIERLCGPEEAPWGDLQGKPLDARRLARMLAPYNVGPTTIRFGATTAKGYRTEDFADAWARYLPTFLSSGETVTCVTAAADTVPTDPTVTDVTDVTVCQ
jgi:hypothetical protein